MQDESSNRVQVNITISKALYDRLESLSLETNLSRSRVYELGLMKFADWVEIVDRRLVVQLAERLTEVLGYRRRQSGFRKAVYPKPEVYSPLNETTFNRHLDAVRAGAKQR